MLRKKPLFSIKTSHLGFFVIYAEHHLLHVPSTLARDASFLFFFFHT